MDEKIMDEKSNSEASDSVVLRLEQIEAAFDDENMCLDDALDFFEEAVELGLDVAKRTEANLNSEER